MIHNDQKNEFERDLSFAEYIASFINPEAVSRVKESREKSKNTNFMDDKEFEEMIKNKDFLKVDGIINRTANNEGIIDKRKSARDTRLPKELSSILKINRDNF
jgi:hypothetical protein